MSGLTVSFGGLRKLYSDYGGFRALLASPYIYLAALFSLGADKLIADPNWTNLVFSILPALAGFSIAAFAILVGSIDPNVRAALKEPEPSMQNRRPYLVLISAISHSVIVQVATIFLTLLYVAKPFPYVGASPVEPAKLNAIVSHFCIFGLAYSIFLVAAAVLLIHRIQALVIENS